MTNRVLAETFGAEVGTARRVRQAILVVAGIAALVITAKIRVPMWPVPVTMQTFAVLMIGAGFGMRLGLVTVLGYLALGVLGMSVFTGEGTGLAYLAGPTGGYLVGFAVAAGLMGVLAQRGWDRSVAGMAGAMLLGNAVIYGLGLTWMSWLFAADKGMAWVLQYGMVNFLPGDLLKLALAAMLMPMAWKLVGRARG
ncbi:biotin transporter BioY [Rhodobacteraceae bacterium LMO-12]|nr:biotin transporter BioY [Rhodobacteraceae bacterium LMO-JJ12]